jgi:tetratricopeptide (TPR) repeat protein
VAAAGVELRRAGQDNDRDVTVGGERDRERRIGGGAGHSDVWRADDGEAGARLIVLNMALGGTPREEAARYLAEAADLNPGPAETHFRLGLIASEQSDHTNAVEEFKHAVARDPKNANYHYLLGREYFRVGFWEGAIGEYTRAIEAAPNQAAYYLARADANYRKDEAPAAAADFDRAAELDPSIENIEYWQGYTHRVAGDFDVARARLEHFLAAHPDHVDALASLGFIATEQGRLDDAEVPLRRALQLDPKNLPALYDYARVAVKRRDYAEAVARLERVVAAYPGYTQAYYQLFLAYGRLKQTEKAQAALAEFKRLDALEKQTTQERILDDKLRTQQMLGQQPK